MKNKISRMARTLTIPFLIFFVLATLSIGVVQAASVSIDPLSKNVNGSDTFSVNIVVNPAGQAVMGTQIKLNFDKTVLNLNSAVPGTFLGSSPVQFAKNIDNTNGIVELSYTVAGGDTAKTASGTFATLTFTVKSGAPTGTSSLDLTMAKLTNAAADLITGVIMNDGTITVSPAPGSGSSGGGNPTVQIEPSSISANPAGTFSVNVGVYPAGNAVMGTQIKLNFNKSVLNLNSAVPGTFLGSSPVQFAKNIDNANGTLELGYTVAGGGSAKTANGTFATLTFTVKSDATNGTSSLDLTMAKLTNATADLITGVIMNDGTITVISGSVIPPVDGSVWKFITVPFELENSSVDYVLNGVNYTMIYAWDPVGKKPVTPVTNLKPLNGYVIRMNDTSQQITNIVRKSGPYTPSSLNVFKGWNLIGTSGTNPMSASMNLQPIGGSYYGILNWNVPAQKYDVIGINSNTIPPGTVGTDVFIMQPNVSYWVWATADTSMPSGLVP